MIYTEEDVVKAKNLATKEQMIGRALKHLEDVYTQFDITDTNGYRIDFRFFKYEFEKAMKGE